MVIAFISGFLSAIGVFFVFAALTAYVIGRVDVPRENEGE